VSVSLPRLWFSRWRVPGIGLARTGFGPTGRSWAGVALACVVAALLAAAVLLPLAAQAVEPNERLANPALEARARAISGQLRCLVCQNESIDESGADLAHDIRIFVRQRLTAGDTDGQAIQAVVSRYGTFVLLKPPVEPATYVLWYGPPALVLLGLAGSLLWLRRRQANPAVDTPLNADETRRLNGLMRETDV
jgi:cytochrome c-type biogenesis protein CcmH